MMKQMTDEEKLALDCAELFNGGKPCTKAQLDKLREEYGRRLQKAKQQEKSQRQRLQSDPFKRIVDELYNVASQAIFEPAIEYASEKFSDADMTPALRRKERKFYKQQVVKFKKLAKKFSKMYHVPVEKLLAEFDLNELFYYD